MAEDCIFCKIINKEIPATIVFENENVLAFQDANPVAPVHVLIVPKGHYENILDMSSKAEGLEELKDLMAALELIAGELGVAEKGFRLINNCGAEGGQTVMHTHYHLIGGRSLGPSII